MFSHYKYNLESSEIVDRTIWGRVSTSSLLKKKNPKHLCVFSEYCWPHAKWFNMYLSVFALSAPKVEDSSTSWRIFALVYCHMGHMTEERRTRSFRFRLGKDQQNWIIWKGRFSCPPRLHITNDPTVAGAWGVNDVRWERCLTRSLHRPLQSERAAPSAGGMQAPEAWPSPQQLLLRRTSVAAEEEVQHIHEN